jgi:hypothetical protein
VLAYVFWHRPAPGADPAGYEAALAAFHAALAAHPPEGFAGSVAYRVPGAPWLPGEVGDYEDWYRVDDWAALGRLNAAAVDGPRAAPHDLVAHRAGAGAGGMYRLLAGDPADPAPPAPRAHAAWLVKPPGTGYAELGAALAEAGAAAVWQRQLVLGPAPEYVLHSASRLPLPWPAHHVELVRVTA